MKYILIIALIFNFACNNTKSKRDEATEVKSDKSSQIIYEEETEIAELSKRILLDIPKDDIIAELVYPKIIIYREFEESHARFSYGIRLYNDSSIVDTVFYEDNMADIENISIDTLRFGKMKAPEFIIKFDTYGYHSYGGDGGWAVQYNYTTIWNGNTLERLLDLVTGERTYHNTETEIDSLGETTNCITTSRLRFNQDSKELILDSINSVCNDTNTSHAPKEIYYFKENEFIKRK